MDVGQVRSGTNAEDTFSKMLQQVHMSTEGVAKAIQMRYPSVQKLFDAFLTGGDDVLKDIPIVRNRAGGVATGRALGPAMSRKMARVFTGKDEWELES
jgi:crossover junction endonuclease EME1